MRKDDKPVSLYPLSADDAIEAALHTPPPKKKYSEPCHMCGGKGDMIDTRNGGFKTCPRCDGEKVIFSDFNPKRYPQRKR